ncbi:MAG: cytochrome c [Planctomycetota bacterium]
MCVMRYGTPLLLLVAIGCTSGSMEAKTGAAPALTVSYTDAGEPEGLERFRQWSDTLFQGAQPKGEIAFRNLAAMGVTTVISVDGAAPDLANAHKYGLVYAHVPIGYDAVPREAAIRMIEAARRSKGAVYVHCHHGKHRGPAGMMAIRMTLDGTTADDAVAGLKLSGTSPKYEGLYRDIAAFQVPSGDELAKAPKTIPERVMPDGMVALMITVTERWENLGQSRKEGWKVPADSPDVSPPHEARMLWELYRESNRLGQWKSYDEDFRDQMAEGEQLAMKLEQALRANEHNLAKQHYKALKANCNSCHAAYRN